MMSMMLKNMMLMMLMNMMFMMMMNMMLMMLLNMMLMMLMILEEANVTPKPVGRQGIDKGVEEREDYVWKLSM